MRGFLREINKFLDRTATQEKTQRKQGFPLVVTYSTFRTQATRTIRRTFERILKGKMLDRTFRVIPAYRGNPTLKQLLVWAKLPEKKRMGTSRIRKYTSVKDPVTKLGFKLQNHIRQTLTNCVYVIKCSKCGKLYVGEMGDGLNTRLAHYKYTIRKNHSFLD